MNPRELAELAVLRGAMQKQEELEQLAAFLWGRRVESVLEIGTGHGGSLWFWHHLPANKFVLTIDKPGGDFGGGPTEEDREKIKNWADPSQVTLLCSGDSHTEETQQEVKNTLEAEGYPLVDILFIDGDHTYEGVKKDFKMYWELVRPGGLIIFHDICDHSLTDPSCQVKKFWDEVKEHVFFKYYEIWTLPANWGGIGIIETLSNPASISMY